MLKTLETRIEHYTIYNRTHEEKTELQSKDDMCFMAYDVERIAEGCEKDLKETLLQYKESFQKWNCNFKEFKKICKEYLFEEKSIFTVTKWFLKYYTKPKIFHVIIKYITALFFVNSDMSYYDKVLQIVEKLLESILGKVTIFQNIIPEYVLELSYLYCAIERVDKSFLILKWDPTFGKIYNEYLECRDFAKKLQSSNQEELNIHSSNFVKNMIEKGGIKMDMQIERYNPKEETFVPKDKINEFQEILNECKKKYDKCLLKFNEIKEGNVGAPIVLNNVKNNTLDQRIRKRNWFEREFYGHYSSIFKINNVKYEPIDVTNNVDFSQNGIISKEAESCFENLRNIVNGQAVINMEKHEKFEKSLKAIKRLRDQEENIAEEEGRSQYSYNFVNIEEFF
uniref:Uncharacterized protein n=1 Tax=Parastrongyloides trichosuri TaxID=131310 RepID=A0A0N5A2K3_PARTI